MKKLLLLISIVGLFACEKVGYIAAVEVQRTGSIDTVWIPYNINQVSSNVLGPDLGIRNNILRLNYDQEIAFDVTGFSLLEVKRLSKID